MRDVVGMYDVHEAVGFPTRDSGALNQGFLSLPRDNPKAVQFEPFFIPREPVAQCQAQLTDLGRLGIELFHDNPGQGLAFLVAVGAMRDYPVAINGFLMRNGASPKSFGEFLGEEFPISQTLRLEFLNSLPLFGTGVVGALETAFHFAALPCDWSKADQLMRGLAHFWWDQHQEESRERQGEKTSTLTRNLKNIRAHSEPSGVALLQCILSQEALHQLMFSTCMLHRHFMDGNAMSLNQWIELNTGIAGNTHDIPVHVQSAIYGIVRDRGINLAGKFVIGAPWNNAPVLEGWVRVHYKYLTEAWSADTFMVLPREGLRSLAEQGGATIVGCSPSRAVDHFPVSQQLPSAIPSITKIALEDELTWLSIHSSILLLGTSQKGTSPFAFVTLQHVVVKEVDLAACCIVLVSSLQAVKKVLVPGEQETIALCLLLADGRFQVLEAEHLELRFDDAGVCSEWATALKDFSCQNVNPMKSQVLSFSQLTTSPQPQGDCRQAPKRVSNVTNRVINLDDGAIDSERTT